MRTLTVKLPEHLERRLRAAAVRSSRSTSAVVREALEAWAQSSEPTVGDTCCDLIGSLAGPGDLSTNPTHLEGFGR